MSNNTYQDLSLEELEEKKLKYEATAKTNSGASTQSFIKAFLNKWTVFAVVSFGALLASIKFIIVPYYSNLGLKGAMASVSVSDITFQGWIAIATLLVFFFSMAILIINFQIEIKTSNEYSKLKNDNETEIKKINTQIKLRKNQ